MMVPGPTRATVPSDDMVKIVETLKGRKSRSTAFWQVGQVATQMFIMIASSEVTGDRVLFSSIAQLALLPTPLRLKHGPVIVTVETWSDGSVLARWPETALYGQSTSDTLAIDALRQDIGDFARSMVADRRAETKIGGPLLRQWKAFQEMIDVGALEQENP